MRRQLEQITDLQKTTRDAAMDEYNRLKKQKNQEMTIERDRQRAKELAEKNRVSVAVKRRGRKDMFKAYLEEREVEANDQPAENLEYLKMQKYFRD